MAPLLFDCSTPFLSRVAAVYMASRDPASALTSRDGVFRHASAVSVSIGRALELGYGIRVNSVGLRCHSYAKLLISKSFCDL